MIFSSFDSLISSKCPIIVLLESSSTFHPSRWQHILQVHTGLHFPFDNLDSASTMMRPPPNFTVGMIFLDLYVEPNNASKKLDFFCPFCFAKCSVANFKKLQHAFPSVMESLELTENGDRDWSASFSLRQLYPLLPALSRALWFSSGPYLLDYSDKCSVSPVGNLARSSSV